MSKQDRNLVAGTVATIIAALNGAAFVLGLVVGAGFDLLLVTAVFALAAVLIAQIEFDL